MVASIPARVAARSLLLPLLFLPMLVSAGMVSFFDIRDSRDGCPDGWTSYEPAKGRLIVGTTDADQVGVTIGEPMADLTPPTHTHEFTATVILDSEPVVADGGANKSLTSAGKHSVSGTTNTSDGNIPYMQMLACEQTSGTPVEEALPPEVVAFYADQSCPAGWEVYAKLNERLAVPVPNDARGDEFGMNVGPWVRQMGHDHYFAISDASHDEELGGSKVPESMRGRVWPVVHLSMSEASVALAKSFWPFKKNYGYGKSTFVTSYQFQRTEWKTGDWIPRVKLLPCRKTGGVDQPDKLPEDMLAFVGAQNCPTRWQPYPYAHGRYLVGSPDGGARAEAFGGGPLKSGEQRTHEHEINTELKLDSKGIGGASGCCSGSYAAAGTRSLSGKVIAENSSMAYVQMRYCNVRNDEIRNAKRRACQQARDRREAHGQSRQCNELLGPAAPKKKPRGL